MYDLGFIDLTNEPEKLPPLPAGAVSTSRLTDLVIAMLEAAGATAKEILSGYSEDPILWNLPPRLLTLGRTDCGFTFKPRGDPVEKYLNIHNHYRTKIRRLGLSPLVRSGLVQDMGAAFAHPLAFTYTEAGEESANLFSLEFIMMLAGGELKIWESSVFRYWKDKRPVYSKVALNRKMSELVTPQWIQKVMTSFRGTAVYDTFDVFDRCSLWVDKNLDKSESWKLRAALSWLKACQSPKTAYEFEQRVRHLVVEEYVYEHEPKKSSIYTYDSLNHARDIWMEEDSDPHDAFRKFYGFLVPTYLDDDTFRRLFGTGMVLKEDFKNDLIVKIDLGISRFESWYLRRMTHE